MEVVVIKPELEQEREEGGVCVWVCVCVDVWMGAQLACNSRFKNVLQDRHGQLTHGKKERDDSEEIFMKP